jgi:hypothetical protein
VLATGGSHYGGGSNTLEVWSPPYLFNSGGGPATRPRITSVPSVIRHHRPFQIRTPDVRDIARVTLVRPMAVTHQTDSEQRVIDLEFHHHGAHLDAHLPHAHDEPGLAPLGYYMLFLIDEHGVPSRARFVKLE